MGNFNVVETGLNKHLISVTDLKGFTLHCTTPSKHYVFMFQK